MSIIMLISDRTVVLLIIVYCSQYKMKLAAKLNYASQGAVYISYYTS